MELLIKLIIASLIVIMWLTCAYLGWRVWKLTKRVKQIQEDKQWFRNKALQINKEKPSLSELDKKLILAALNMPEYGKEIQDPKTNFQVRKTYRELKEKIKESFKD